MTGKNRQFFYKNHVQQNFGRDNRKGDKHLWYCWEIVPPTAWIKTDQVGVEPEEKAAQHQAAGREKEVFGALPVGGRCQQHERQDVQQVF